MKYLVLGCMYSLVLSYYGKLSNSDKVVFYVVTVCDITRCDMKSFINFFITLNINSVIQYGGFGELYKIRRMPVLLGACMDGWMDDKDI